jgi:hypothetical protein
VAHLAGVTQLVEFLPSKQAVAGSSPVSRFSSTTVVLKELHRPIHRKQAVKTDEKDGFLLAQKAFNDNLPSVSGKHLFRFPRTNKSVHKPFHP